MRRAAMILLPALILTSCARPLDLTTGEMVSRVSIERAAREGFGWSMQAVTARPPSPGNPGWSVRVVLGSTPDTATVHRGAARILSAAASQDSSDTPIFVSVVARDLRLTSTTDNWGSLSYDWSVFRGGSQHRGSEIRVFHGDAADPNRPPCASAYAAPLLGFWPGASEQKLGAWAENGTPPLEPGVPPGKP